MEQQVIKIECRVCGGTGLFAGFPLKEGAAVPCQQCKGTGCEEIKGTPFTGLKLRVGISHVWASTVNNTMTPDNLLGGVTYTEWVEDPQSVYELGREARDKACPASWYQGVRVRKQPNWDACAQATVFHRCPFWSRKGQCWEQYDLEQNQEAIDNSIG